MRAESRVNVALGLERVAPRPGAGDTAGVSSPQRPPTTPGIAGFPGTAPAEQSPDLPVPVPAAAPAPAGGAPTAEPEAAGRRGVRPRTADREAAAVRLREAFVDDRLTLDEYSERLSAVYAAGTDVELEALVADLPEVEGAVAEEPPAPAQAPPPASAPAPVERHERHGRGPRHGWRAFAGPAVAAALALGFVGGVPDQVAVMGGNEVDAAQILGGGDSGETTVATLMGGSEVDLRGLQPGQEVTIEGAAVMGGVDVVVDPGTQVNLGGFAMMGGRDCEDSVCEAQVPEGAPVVNVSVNALMGGVKVTDQPDRDDD